MFPVSVKKTPLFMHFFTPGSAGSRSAPASQAVCGSRGPSLGAAVLWLLSVASLVCQAMSSQCRPGCFTAWDQGRTCGPPHWWDGFLTPGLAGRPGGSVSCSGACRLQMSYYVLRFLGGANADPQQLQPLPAGSPRCPGHGSSTPHSGFPSVSFVLALNPILSDTNVVILALLLRVFAWYSFDPILLNKFN